MAFARSQGRIHAAGHECCAVTYPTAACETDHTGRRTSNPRRLLWMVIATVGVLACVAGAWRFTPLHEIASVERIADWLRGFSREPWAPVMIVLIYVAANAVFFPNTILNTATILGLGTLWGLPTALTGSVVAAMIAYALGRRYGQERLQNLDSKMVDRLAGKFRAAGPLQIAMLRLLPIAPYGVVNLVAGSARVHPFSFGLGTVLGLLPGNLLVTAFGHQLRSVLRDPSTGQVAIMGAVVAIAAGGIWWTRRQATAARH